MFNIKTLNKISPLGLDLFDDKYTVDGDCENPDAYLVRSAAMHDMTFGDNLLAIARAGAGVNNIPIDACSEKGIVVFNTPGANANAVKELAVAALLLSSRKIVDGINWAGTLTNEENVAKAVEKGKSAFVGPELKGKTLGVIGFGGAIGIMVANIAKSLGMSVMGYDPYITVEGALHVSRSVSRVTDLNTIYANCDYISLHVPSTDETRGMIGEEAFKVMKKGMRVINLARADLVDSDAMKAALKNGTVASYVTDFPTNEMINVENVITIPHLGASTPESEDNCAVMAVEEIKDFLENGNITHSVNYPNLCEPKTTDYRICVIHQNQPGLIANISATLGKDGINIENMTNRAKKNNAYTVLDIEKAPEQKILDDVRAIDGVVRVFVV